MFKTLTLAKFPDSVALPSAAKIESALDKHQFIEIGATQKLSVGFTPPRGQAHGALVESIGGHYLLSLAIEQKSVPASILKAHVEKAAKAIEKSTGRVPGKKETRELKVEAELTLLPKAFPKRVDITVWIDSRTKRIYVDNASSAKVNQVFDALGKALELGMELINTQESPASLMCRALLSEEGDLPNGFSIERTCFLKSSDESSTKVKFENHHLLTKEVKKHIAEGKLPVELALSWDAKVSFNLTDKGVIKKIAFMDIPEGSGDEDRFDADVALTCPTLSAMVQNLLDAMGGEAAFDATDGGAEAQAESAEDRKEKADED